MKMSLSCGHEFCASCWKGFLAEKISSNGRLSLHIYCQQNHCSCLVPHSWFITLFGNSDSKTQKEKEEDEKIL